MIIEGPAHRDDDKSRDVIRLFVQIEEPYVTYLARFAESLYEGFKAVPPCIFMA